MFLKVVFPSEMPVSRMVPAHASAWSSKALSPSLCQAEVHKSHSPIQGLLSYGNREEAEAPTCPLIDQVGLQWPM